MLSLPNAFGLTLELSDKFGYHGLIAVTICVPGVESGILMIDTLLMSCRVINRTAEHFLINAVAEESIRQGFQTIMGEYIPTAKNELTRDLFPSCGFQLQVNPENRFLFVRSLLELRLKTFVR